MTCQVRYFICELCEVMARETPVRVVLMQNVWALPSECWAGRGLSERPSVIKLKYRNQGYTGRYTSLVISIITSTDERNN